MNGSSAIRPGVAAVVRDPDGRVLLHQRRAGGGWAPPSGAVEYGEALLAALARELFAETGLTVSVERLVGVYSDPAYQVVRYPDGRRVHFVTALFLCSARTAVITGNAEGLAWAWFPPAALPPDLTPYARVWLADALAGGPAPAVR